ncbi:MAG: MBL fold metallo-hydrolase [Bacteroidales bacterium]|jgi:phosphoribosyl 1,2-cyclic phosphate phosphodiesterase|nr:MBL fold metallo-hydrolase [Bacteroidales bacterium]
MDNTLSVTFLGTGTSIGVPIISCDCKVCVSNNPKDKRLRTSVLLNYRDKNIVIDCGPDFRMQMLNAGVKDLDAILLTHEHRDHIAGLDDVRAFNYIKKKSIHLFLSERVLKNVKIEFPYIFTPGDYQGGPKLDLHNLINEEINIAEMCIQPLPVMHREMPVFGFRIGDFSYITDANFIPDETFEKIKGSKILVLNALRKRKHPSHFCLSEALEMIEKIKPEKAYLTHLGHYIGLHDDVNTGLPENVELAYDGLQIDLNYQSKHTT